MEQRKEGGRALFRDRWNSQEPAFVLDSVKGTCPGVKTSQDCLHIIGDTRMNLFRTTFAAISLLVSSVAFAAPAPTTDIVDTAVAAGSFKTLAAALQAAGLVDTLKGKGPFTVFAPTDAAFAKLPAGTVEALLKDKAKLTKILTYHVVSGEVMSKDVKSGMVKTVEGESIDIKVSANGVMVNNAKVVGVDVMSTNGVIHVIDTVLIPR
jgi:uncharacterized surface protein with fasciclin (FAS1) repeats